MDDKAITIITTIHPAKKGGKRAVTVAAAPEGEMPLMLTGVFAERHQLADRAFGELLKRKPLTPKVTAAAAKPAGGRAAVGKAKKTGNKKTPATRTGAVEGGAIAAAEESDQIGPAVETPAAPAGEALPEIEGDNDGQLELQLEGSDG